VGQHFVKGSLLWSSNDLKVNLVSLIILADSNVRGIGNNFVRLREREGERVRESERQSE